MPPKGWRKNADGSYPQPTKDTEIKSIDEILFPRSIVQRLSKEITNSESDNMNMAKDSLLALQRSATVFVSHILFHAKMVANQSDRKHVNAQDIIAALERAEYSGFVPEVKQNLSQYEANMETKKKKKASEKTSNSGDVESDPKRLKADGDIGTKDASEGDDDDDNVEEIDDGSDVDMEANNDDTEEVLEDSNVAEEEEGEAANPISAISKEEDELEGTVIEEIPDKSSDEEED